MIELLTLVSTVVVGLSIARRAKARPVVLAEPPVASEPIAAPRPGWYEQRRLRVLVVDDRALVGAQIARMLPAHDVTSVTSAEAAVTAACQGQFDAILYSFAMPGRSGFAFADLLAARQPAARPCLVLLLDRTPSAGMLDKVARTGLRWITKPLHYAALATAVDAAAAHPMYAPAPAIAVASAA